MNFLYLLESIRSPLLDECMSALTLIGDETVFIAVALVVFWCCSKQCGLYLLVVGFFNILINQFIKITCRVPRPWVLDPNFTIVESARAGAGGYSFPSGHTANAVSLFGCCAAWTKNRAIRITCIAAIVIVAFSRMYLGVHTPADVLFSLVVATALVLIARPVFRNADTTGARLTVIFAILTGLSFLFALWTNLHAFGDGIDSANLHSAQKNAWLLTGGGFAIIIGNYIERKYIRFEVGAPFWAQVLKCVLGIAIIFGIKSGGKVLLSALFGGAMFTNALRYGMIVLFATCVWPLTFKWFAAGCPLKRKR